MNRISPTVLLVIVIIAIGFFLLGLVQLVIRCLTKRPSFSSSLSQSNRLSDAAAAAPHTFQRQLQHLFRLDDSGLDQSLIDSLPVFYHKDIIGLKEPFDCAVCLSEFSHLDKLKFLPTCTHAFHIHCIQTWLLSNSSCPLCRTLIGLPNMPLSRGLQDNARIFSIRIGKFRSTNEGVYNDVTSSSIDGRRCYSMGAFQYVVGNVDLQVALPSFTGGIDGEKMGMRMRGDSFSVSKIWLWSKFTIKT